MSSRSSRASPQHLARLDLRRSTATVHSSPSRWSRCANRFFILHSGYGCQVSSGLVMPCSYMQRMPCGTAACSGACSMCPSGLCS